jgi:hypothetical protein
LLNTQAKLQKAQQQREYAKAFHADVLKKLAAEQAAQQEAAAARSRLASLRARLVELHGLNADRRQRAEDVQEQVQVLKVSQQQMACQLTVLCTLVSWNAAIHVAINCMVPSRMTLLLVSTWVLVS